MKKMYKPLIVILFILFIWSWLSKYSNPLFLPKPQSVFESLIELYNTGFLVNSTIKSFNRITIATLMSILLSLPIGLLVVNYKMIEKIIIPITGLMRYIPVTVFYPLLIMWLGIGEEMKITFLFMATFFYFLPTVILSLKETPQDLVETGQTIGMTKFQLMYKIYLPYSIPSILQSFLMMYAIGWTYIIIAEVVNAKCGLGYIINLGSARGRTDLVFASLFIIICISWIFDNLGNYIIKKVFKWKFSRELD